MQISWGNFHRKYVFSISVLLKAKTKSIVSKKRIDAINQAVNNWNQVIIFDDGLQEKKIDYDLKIVCFKKKMYLLCILRVLQVLEMK